MMSDLTIKADRFARLSELEVRPLVKRLEKAVLTCAFLSCSCTLESECLCSSCGLDPNEKERKEKRRILICVSPMGSSSSLVFCAGMVGEIVSDVKAGGDGTSAVLLGAGESIGLNSEPGVLRIGLSFSNSGSWTVSGSTPIFSSTSTDVAEYEKKEKTPI